MAGLSGRWAYVEVYVVAMSWAPLLLCGFTLGATWTSPRASLPGWVLPFALGCGPPRPAGALATAAQPQAGAGKGRQRLHRLG